MNFSAVIISLCALVALAHGKHLGDAAKSRAVNTTLQQMHQKINATLRSIDRQREILPNISFKMEELEQAKQGNLTAAKLSQFRCHIMNASMLTPELEDLKDIIQKSKDVELWLSGQVEDWKCTLPTFEEEEESYIYIERLLELLVELLTEAKF